MFFPLFLLLLCLANAQTTTVLNPAGQTVVGVITLGVDGLPTTSIVQTLVGDVDDTTTTTTPIQTTTTTPATTTTTSPTTTTPTTTLPPQQGPVGQPAPTIIPPGGVTPFTYTTVIAGETIVTTDAFTPSIPATTPHTPTAVGTVWDYSQWLSQYASAQTSSSPANHANPTLGLNMWMVTTVVACISLGFTLPFTNTVFAL